MIPEVASDQSPVAAADAADDALALAIWKDVDSVYNVRNNTLWSLVHACIRHAGHIPEPTRMQWTPAVPKGLYEAIEAAYFTHKRLARADDKKLHMRLHVLSDLHLEFTDYFSPDPVVIQAADVIVLAGDIDIGTGAVLWAREVFGDKPVVYVLGNHEFYGGDWTQTLEEVRLVAQREGVHFLENDEIVIGGVRFLGCTLWTDFRYFGDNYLEAAISAYQLKMNDCQRISAQSRLADPNGTAAPRQLTPDLVIERHEQSRAWLEERLATPFNGKTVFVTHHGPNAGSVGPRWANSFTTPGFVSKLSAQMIAGADLWVHGHTHDSHDYLLPSEGPGGPKCTRVVVNPRGYPRGRASKLFENREFKPDLLIEL